MKASDFEVCFLGLNRIISSSEGKLTLVGLGGYIKGQSLTQWHQKKIREIGFEGSSPHYCSPN